MRINAGGLSNRRGSWQHRLSEHCVNVVSVQKCILCAEGSVSVRVRVILFISYEVSVRRVCTTRCESP